MLAPPEEVKSIFVWPIGRPSTSRSEAELSASTTVIGSPDFQFGCFVWVGGWMVQFGVPSHTPTSWVSPGAPETVAFHSPTPVILRLVRSMLRLLPAPLVLSGTRVRPLSLTCVL